MIVYIIYKILNTYFFKKINISMKRNFFENDLRQRKEREYDMKIRKRVKIKECGQEEKQSWRLKSLSIWFYKDDIINI